MARIRTIKPEFFTSEDIVELDPLARLLYIALWCEADKEGRLAWKPKTFKMRYLPADDEININTLCDALVTRGLIVLYGDGLAFIPTFKEHQHINPREKESCLPVPTEENITRARRVDDASVTGREEGRKEGKGREGKGRELVGQAALIGDADPVAGDPDPVQQVFDHWRTVMESPKSLLDDKRKKAIKTALKTGYTVEQLCAAIKGCRKSPFHMGENERRTKYNTIELILRGADYIDKFITIGQSELVPTPPPPRAGRPSINDMGENAPIFDDPFERKTA